MQNVLTEKEVTERRKEIALLTQQGYSLNQIAKKYNLSRQRIHQILQKAKEEGHEVITYKRPESPQKIRECIVCKKQFHRKWLGSKTCSKDCTSKSLIGGKWSRHEFITLTCSNCGKEFKRSHYLESVSNAKCKKEDRLKFCSKECYWSSNFFKQVGKYKGIKNAKNPKKRNSL